MCMLRHNAASMMVQNSIPLTTIAAILGHAETRTTDIYITADISNLKECVLPLAGTFDLVSTKNLPKSYKKIISDTRKMIESN